MNGASEMKSLQALWDAEAEREELARQDAELRALAHRLEGAATRCLLILAALLLTARNLIA